MKKIIEKIFGEDLDEQQKARGMLLIYGVFIILIVLYIRSLPAPKENNNGKTTSNEEIITSEEVVTSEEENTNTEEKKTRKKKIDYDVNYSYSYTIVYDGNTETYLGKKIDDKEKFSYIRDDNVQEFAVIDGTYLLKGEDKYHIVDSLNGYFRYCNIEEIVDIVSELVPVSLDNLVYEVDNSDIAFDFDDDLVNDNQQTNRIEIVKNDQTITKVYMDLSNYISSFLGSNHTLNITMEFADVGTTEDFSIKVN